MEGLSELTTDWIEDVDWCEETVNLWVQYDSDVYPLNLNFSTNCPNWLGLSNPVTQFPVTKTCFVEVNMNKQ